MTGELSSPAKLRTRHWPPLQISWTEKYLDGDLSGPHQGPWKSNYKQAGPKRPRSLTWEKGHGSQWRNLQSTTNDAIYQIRKLFNFRQEDFWKLHFKNLFFDPVTYMYLCNKSKPFEQFWLRSTQGQFLLSLVKFPLAVQNEKSVEVFLI